jgi:hypothetical protein
VKDVYNENYKPLKKEIEEGRVLVAHAYNPSYSGGRYQED